MMTTRHSCNVEYFMAEVIIKQKKIPSNFDEFLKINPSARKEWTLFIWRRLCVACIVGLFASSTFASGPVKSKKETMR